jgi:hypothetical protein
MDSQTQNTTTLTEAQACVVIEQGVKREFRKDSERTLDYCKDAVKLQGFNVRKLAQKCEIRAEEKGENFNADSYQSNVSNANGVMALFEFDIVSFEEWLKTSDTKSLSAIFKAFRQLFVEPKTTKTKKDQTPDSEGAGEDTAKTPLIDVVLSALPMLTAEERQLVAMMIIELDTVEADVAEDAVAA